MDGRLYSSILQALVVAMVGALGSAAPPEQVCGKSNVGSAVAGGSTEPGTPPWHAALFYKADGDAGWKAGCGGTLITPRVVLTVAHCMWHSTSKGQKTKVILGKSTQDWNITEDKEQRFEVEEVAFHPDFNISSRHHLNDVALLRLDRATTVNTDVMPACTTPVDLVQTNTLDGYVAQWGSKEDCSPADAGCVLRKRISVISAEECRCTVPSGASRLVEQDKYCADAKVQTGSSGNGMTVVHNGAHYALGIVSVSIRGTSIIGLTSVPYYMKWIQEQLDRW